MNHLISSSEKPGAKLKLFNNRNVKHMDNLNKQKLCNSLAEY